ncbi:hypothetical protein PMAYCL1PPCAC_10100, partial [Pristionchus mayeri]
GGGVAGAPTPNVMMNRKEMVTLLTGTDLGLIVGAPANVSMFPLGEAIEIVPQLRRERSEKNRDRVECHSAHGFAIRGFIGFFVKLIHIPINN